MSSPLISVIVSVYNGEKYLETCILSIVRQDYENLQIILINDGSTDESLQIMENGRKLDSRIEIIDKENTGVSDSRNKGLELSRGSYLCFVDQDDILAPSFISYLYNLIEQTSADIALTPSVKRFTGKKPNFEQSATGKINQVTGTQAAAEMLYYHYVIAPWNKLISKNLIEKSNLQFDTRFFGGEGFLFSIQCFLSTNYVAVGNEEIYGYRIDNTESGMTRYKESIITSCISAQETIGKVVSEYGETLINAARYANWHTHCDCLNMILGCHAEKGILFDQISAICKSEAKIALKVPISKKEKCKAIAYMIHPTLAACLINKFRKRKFTIVESEERK